MDRIKKISSNLDKCTGCGTCELICSLHHSGVINPRKSRIRVVRDTEKGQCFPVIAGPVTKKECKTKAPIVIGGQVYDECLLCRASCSSREFFGDPDTGESITCDLCAKCVIFCNSGALSLVRRK